MMWVRWTLPRLRIDQVMMTCLKYLIPISCVLLVGVSLWMLLVPPPVQVWLHYGIFALCMVGLVWFIVTLVTFASQQPGEAMPGMWRMTDVPGYQGAKQTS